ncbi:SRPBCC domain-containing protein [Nocardiopsis prasina]|uniref:SRPBCC domain-containing protein n=1 Tax=Nocardiopsis prasina TaxID=2015 RepID=UPI00037CC685|nr:SRPBCC domain-containing protein [Nocardiopsis prasina]
MVEMDLVSLGDDRWTLTVERNLGYPSEAVWRAITEPEGLSRWYPMAVERLDLRVGGEIAFRDEEGGETTAVVTEVEPLRVFGFREFDPETGEHQLRLTLEGDGRLVLAHTFTGREWAERTTVGWRTCLNELENSLR